MLKFIIFVQLITYIASDLSCQRCASEDPDSDCRNGKIKEKFTCPADEQACYTEDLINEGKPPYYRRGCAPPDWCDQQKKSHSAALKFCSVCTEDMCNNKRIGAENPDILECFKCNSEDVNSQCKKGLIGLETESCPPSSKYCAESYASTSGRDIYTRQCATDQYCSKLNEQFGHSVQRCKLCQDDFCNNNELPIYY